MVKYLWLPIINTKQKNKAKKQQQQQQSVKFRFGSHTKGQ